MHRLIKLSDPGWIRDFETEDDLAKELRKYVCLDCLLNSPCGAEFMMENDDG